jgi:hypothetical protein
VGLGHTAEDGFTQPAVAVTLSGLALLSVRFLETWLPPASGWLQGSFFPSTYPWPLRASALRAILEDAAMGSLPLFAMAGVAILRLRERVSASAAVALIAAIVAADLIRAGAGLNPTARDLYELSPEMKEVSARLRTSGGRVLTCAVQATPAHREAVRQRPGRLGIWSYGVLRESLTPYANLDVGVPAVGRDPTDLVPADRSLTADEEMCKAAGALEKIRGMGVRHLLAVQPIISKGVRLVGAVSPARITPLSIYVHEVENGLPDPSVALSADDVDERGIAHPLVGARARYVNDSPETLRIAVETPAAAYLILRRAHAVGWSATVNGAPTEVLPANGRHQAVRVPVGTSEVELRYSAPHLWHGVLLSSLGAIVALALGFPNGRWSRGDSPSRLPIGPGEGRRA